MAEKADGASEKAAVVAEKAAELAETADEGDAVIKGRRLSPPCSAQ